MNIVSLQQVATGPALTKWKKVNEAKMNLVSASIRSAAQDNGLPEGDDKY
jgi:hypothetical protein